MVSPALFANETVCCASDARTTAGNHAEPSRAMFWRRTGQRTFGQVSVEPAIDYSNGSTVYLLTPDKAPFPSKANPVATAPLYLPVIP
jgi:hypothetical protein